MADAEAAAAVHAAGHAVVGTAAGAAAAVPLSMLQDAEGGDVGELRGLAAAGKAASGKGGGGKGSGGRPWCGG